MPSPWAAIPLTFEREGGNVSTLSASVLPLSQLLEATSAVTMAMVGGGHDWLGVGVLGLGKSERMEGVLGLVRVEPNEG